MGRENTEKARPPQPLLNHLGQAVTHSISAHIPLARTRHIVPLGYEGAWGWETWALAGQGFSSAALDHGKGVHRVCHSKAEGEGEDGAVGRTEF